MGRSRGVNSLLIELVLKYISETTREININSIRNDLKMNYYAVDNSIKFLERLGIVETYKQTGSRALWIRLVRGPSI